MVAGLLFGISGIFAFDAEDLHDLLGYTIVGESHVSDTFEGADFDKAVQLDNGMVFIFHTYHYTYAYRPEVIICASAVGSSYAYKLVIKDYIYSVTRVR